MVEVDKDDQAFNNPTKPIGVFFSEEEAKRLEKEHGFVMVEVTVVLYLLQNHLLFMV